MRKTVLAAVAFFTIASGAGVMQASAADYFEPAPAPVPAPILHDWSGFYIGGHVGYGGADFRVRGQVEDTLLAPDERVIFDATERLEADGLLGGIHGGLNWQVGAFVLGIEGDVSFVDWDDSFHRADTLTFGTGEAAFDRDFDVRARADVDLLASVRGRLGMAFDTLLIYGTGGVAFSDAEGRATVRFEQADSTFEEFTHKVDFEDVGWVIGGGAEWAAIPNRFSLGVEGLWYFFEDRQDVEVDIFDDETAFVRVRSELDDAWVIRGRANFHF